LTNELINPNWHVILIHFPLGVFLLGVLFECFSFLYRRSPVRTVARGMIWIGALAALPTAYSGIYAFADVVHSALPQGTSDVAGMSWSETRALASGAGGLTPAQWDLLGGHVWCQAIATGVAAVLVTLGVGANDRWRQKLQLPLMAGLLFAALAMGWGAYYGGEMVFRHGLAVDVVMEKGSTPPTPSIPPTTQSASNDQPRGLYRAIPPLQVHVTLAGLAAALAFAALGMSLRMLSTGGEWRDPEVSHAHNLIDMEAGPRKDDAYHAAQTSPDADAGHGPLHIPSGRFWLLTSLGALLTALAAYWFLASPDGVGTWNPRILWDEISSKPRPLYHAITGSSIVVLPLLLALAARFARRSKALLGILTAALVVALGFQTWLGVLLLVDSRHGKVTGFNKPGSATVTASAERQKAEG
jgi:uncharacterized membrane protein